jgi:hypothetical protein
MGRPVQIDEIPLQPQMVLEPFDKWAIDFVGPINPPSVDTPTSSSVQTMSQNGWRQRHFWQQPNKK